MKITKTSTLLIKYF